LLLHSAPLNNEQRSSRVTNDFEWATALLLLLTTLFNCTYYKPIVTANAKTVRFAGQK
jgi:hypothetical protein